MNIRTDNEWLNAKPSAVNLLEKMILRWPVIVRDMLAEGFKSIGLVLIIQKVLQL